MVCITGKSFVSAVKQGSGRAYQYAREDMDRRKEIHAQRAEERKLLREEQRVRGVNLNATRLTAVDEGRRPVPEDAEYDEEAFEREFGTKQQAAKPEMDEIPEEKPAATGKNRVVYEGRRGDPFSSRRVQGQDPDAIRL